MEFKLKNILSFFRKNMLIIIMRTFIFLCCITTFGFTPNDVLSQNTKIKIDANATLTIDEVFKLIKEQTDYKFIYQKGIFKDFPKVRVKKGTISANKLLQKSLSSGNLSVILSKDDKTVLVKEKEKIPEIISKPQGVQISGNVLDNNGQPLPGANVLEKGTTNGTQTDFDGKFSLDVNNSDAIIVISYVGFTTQEVALDSRSTINVTLQEDSALLDEVVVIGYGSVKKSDLTGSVTSVTSKDFNKNVSANIDQLFQGKAAGVTISQTSAQPGGAASISIRGNTSLNASNQPLYVIDGLPIDNSSPSGSNQEGVVYSTPPGNPLNTLNPNDIQSIEILKDASATAIYGSRGANGVILITTKKGKGKLSVNYSSTTSIQDIAKEYDVLNAFEYATLFNEYFDYRTVVTPGDADLQGINKFTNTELQAFQNGQGTDWFNVLTRTGVINNQQLSVSSGNETGSIYSSINFLDHKGVLQNSDTQRVAARLNVTQKIANAVEFGTNISISNLNSNTVPYGGEFGDRGGAISGVFNWAPTIAPLNTDGTLADHPESTNIANPLASGLSDSNSEDDRILATTYIEASLSKNLKAKLVYGFDKTLTKTRNYVPSTAKSALAPAGIAELATFQIDNRLTDFILTYDNQFGDHKLNVVGATSKQVRGFENVRARGVGFATDALTFNNLGSAEAQTTQSGKSESTLISFLGRVNYNYKDKYLLTFSGRYDGSSKFDVDNKWGFFPSGAFAWKVINESFMEDQNLFSDLKFRVSYGEVGNQEIGNNASQPLIGTRGGGRLIGAVIGDQFAIPFEPISPGSPGLTWETTKQFNTGIDLGFFNQRLNVIFDYYNIVTSDLLLSFSIPSTSGFTSIIRNAGEIKNSGVELTINSINITNPDFEWSTNFNISYNENKWNDRAGLPFGIEQEFGPVGGLYGYITDGLWQEGDDLDMFGGIQANPGTLRFKDVNGRDADGNITGQPDGEITEADRVLLGNSTPAITAGLSNTLRYKDFSLSFFFNGQFDYSIFNSGTDRLTSVGRILQLGGVGRQALNYWTPNNTNTDVPNGLANPLGGSNNSRFIEKGDFIRLKNVNLSYNVPVDNFSWLNGLTVGIGAENLFIITDYTGLDPETSRPGFTRVGSRGDLEPYPNSRTYTLSVNLNF